MLPIAWITLRRITERAVLVQFGVLALVLVYVGLGLESIVLTEPAATESAGLNVIGLFLTVFTIFWCTIEIPREVGRKEVLVYLAKPLSRFGYLLGKYLGMTAMVLAGEAVLLAVFAACLLITGHRPGIEFLFGAARIAMFLALINAVCVAASIVLAEVPAIVLVLVVSAGASVVFALAVLAWAAFEPATGRLYMAGYYLLPNLLHYRWHPVAGPLHEYAGALLAYTAGWVGVCLVIAWGIFSRLDLG
jgi:ABC-type transport system involved in multi-copper enzyme maturation permease subunit